MLRNVIRAATWVPIRRVFPINYLPSERYSKASHPAELDPSWPASFFLAIVLLVSRVWESQWKALLAGDLEFGRECRCPKGRYLLSRSDRCRGAGFTLRLFLQARPVEKLQGLPDDWMQQLGRPHHQRETINGRPSFLNNRLYNTTRLMDSLPDWKLEQEGCADSRSTDLFDFLLSTTASAVGMTSLCATRTAVGSFGETARKLGSHGKPGVVWLGNLPQS